MSTTNYLAFVLVFLFGFAFVAPFILCFFLWLCLCLCLRLFLCCVCLCKMLAIFQHERIQNCEYKNHRYQFLINNVIWKNKNDCVLNVLLEGGILEEAMEWNRMFGKYMEGKKPKNDEPIKNVMGSSENAGIRNVVKKTLTNVWAQISKNYQK